MIHRNFETFEKSHRGAILAPLQRAWIINASKYYIQACDSVFSDPALTGLTHEQEAMLIRERIIKYILQVAPKNPLKPFNEHFSGLTEWLDSYGYVILSNKTLLDATGQPNNIKSAKMYSRLSPCITFANKHGCRVVKVSDLACAMYDDFAPLGSIMARENALALYQQPQAPTIALEAVVAQLSELSPRLDLQMAYGEELSEIVVNKEIHIRLNGESFDIIAFPDKFIGVSFAELVRFVESV